LIYKMAVAFYFIWWKILPVSLIHFDQKSWKIQFSPEEAKFKKIYMFNLKIIYIMYCIISIGNTCSAGFP
jgi:hypothetical protein